MSERAIIDLFNRPSRRARVGVGDDAAVMPDGQVLTTDTMVEGRHWDDTLSPADVGWKLVAVNASDLGAMGARPAWAMLAIAIPDPPDLAWVAQFRDGLFEALAAFDLELVGGDTVSAPTRTLTLSVGGYAARGVLRSTARVGDDVYVTGALGLAAEGFLSHHPSPAALAALRRPTPPTTFGVLLAEAGLPSAMMDLSDGLQSDLGTLCRASGVGAVIRPEAIPGVPDLGWRVSFGEDYQLLFTAPPGARSAVESLSASAGVIATRIGEVVPGASPRLIGTPWPEPLFTHFPRSSC